MRRWKRLPAVPSNKVTLNSVVPPSSDWAAAHYYDFSTARGNLCSNFAFFMGTEEALRSVLRAFSIFQHLSHLPVASPSL